MRTAYVGSDDSLANPLDLMEQIASAHDWMFERSSTSDMSLEVVGQWCDYRMFLSWHPEVSALLYVCAYDMRVPEQGRLVSQSVPLRNAMNEILRDGYVDDNQRGVDMWNKTLAEADLDFRVKLPHRSFNRNIGIYAGFHVTPEGEPITEEEWNRRRDEWLPSDSDRAYIASLMKPVHESGKMANWIAAPPRGIDNKPLDFEYVRLD